MRGYTFCWRSPVCFPPPSVLWFLQSRFVSISFFPFLDPCDSACLLTTNILGFGLFLMIGICFFRELFSPFPADLSLFHGMFLRGRSRLTRSCPLSGGCLFFSLGDVDWEKTISPYFLSLFLALFRPPRLVSCFVLMVFS